VELEARAETYPLAETFVISRDSSDESESVIVELRHNGLTGYGEGAPIERYYEDGAGAVEFLHTCRGALGGDPFALDEILDGLPPAPHTQAARAALDNALHDLCGKLTGRPVWRLLGLRREGPPTCWTVWLGDPDDMARRAEKAAPRFRRLKLKLGGRDGLDVERVRAVRAVTDLPLQVDVNEYWSVDEALEALPQLAGLGVEYCEQPLPEGDPGGARVKAASPVPIYVDEDCHTLGDVASRVAHSADPLDVEAVAAAELQLEPSEAAGDALCSPGGRRAAISSSAHGSAPGSAASRYASADSADSS